jgi:small nuclear ribonucleoprotein (snRNP)-like protein
MEQFPQPIQALHDMRNKVVVVETKLGEKVEGKLVAFDLYTNITLNTGDGTRFIQGGTVNFVYLKDAEKMPAPAEEAAPEQESGDDATGHSPDDSTA